MVSRNYPPISDYAFIGDCHSVALVSRTGSIDWCCMPRIDSGSSFGRILDWDHGGYCQIVPTDSYQTHRSYLKDTLIMETVFSQGQDNEARLIDCFSMREGGRHNPYQQVLRFVNGVKGKVRFQVEIVPRFDYGTLKPWIRAYQENAFVVLGGDDGLLISGDMPLSLEDRHSLTGVFTVQEGEQFHLSLLFRRPVDLDDGIEEIPSLGELHNRMESTRKWWRSWSSQVQIEGFHAECVRRSAIVLKALTNAPTGAIAAAPTTSLPEVIGGSMNWDYRYSWIRDSTLTTRSLGELGYKKEADGFRRFVERTAAGSAEQLQILFGVGGERRIHEHTIQELEGYAESPPVRIGNAAKDQLQLDIYGHIFELSWQWHKWGHSPNEDYWEFLTGMADGAARKWNKPDRGIWEIRGDPRHFVHSKVMCWLALDRAVRMAEEMKREGPIEKWRQTREDIREAVENKGFDPDRGVFIQAFDNGVMDASLLRLPLVGFIDFQDERMVHTVDAIREDLMEDGLVRRYPVGKGEGGKEGVFLACSFWLVECLARQERMEEAEEAFRRAIDTGNDLNLFSEEYDPRRHAMLGNFPQGLTHLSLIAAAVTMNTAIKREKGEEQE